MKVYAGNFLSLREQVESNKVVMQMLGYIHEFMQLPEDVRSNTLIFAFRKTRDSKAYETNPAIFHGADRRAPVVYFPPDGCNMDDVFECLYYEVLKLAYVMTGGAIDEQDEECVVKTAGEYGPVITYSLKFVRRF